MSDTRRLLLVDYHYGIRGATGGVRWRSMTAALAREGWRFDVVTLASAGAADPVPDGVRIFPVPSPTFVEDAVRLASRALKVLRGAPRAAPAAPASAALPSPAPAGVASPGRVRAALVGAITAVRITVPEWVWMRRAARLGRRLARESRYAAVIVSSPPHIAHLAGAEIAARTGVPFVADFRDPWVFGRPDKYDWSPVGMRLGRRYEAPTLRQAALVITNTEHARRAVAAIYPELADRTLAVANGYDAGQAPPPAPDPGVFRIVFAGWLYPFMDPESVLAAAGRLRARAGLGPDRFAVAFMGCEPVHHGRVLAEMAAAHGLEGCFRHHPPAPREEARRLQAAAAVLVVFDQSTDLAVPAKFYDCAQMGGTMLLVGHPEGALAAAAAKLGLRVFAPDDKNGMDAALDEALRRWRAGTMVPPLDREGLFDRRHQVRIADDALRALAARAG